MLKSTLRSTSYHVCNRRYERSCKKMFDLDFQGQTSRSGFGSDFEFFEILDLENVRIDSKVKSASCIQPELIKVMQCMCVTLSSKVNRQGHGFVFNIFDILDLENVRIDTKINFVSCLQPEIWKVMQKGVWPWFSRSCNKDGICSLSPLDSLTPENIPMRNISEKFGREDQNPGGGGTHPPWASKVDFYLGHLRVKVKKV